MIPFGQPAVFQNRHRINSDKIRIEIGKFAAKLNIPIGGALISAGEYRSVYGVNVNIPNSGKTAAILADKILKGTPAGTIPVVSAENYFEIDYKTATEFGLKLKEGLLYKADKIIR